MTQKNQCPECGADLPASAPRGLCPACLLKQGLQTNTVGFTAEDAEPEVGTWGERGGEHGGGGKSGGWVPPTVEEIAARFTELEITRIIGRGGMGAVYEARQKSLDRVVALKILPPEMGLGRGGAFAERFTREARAMAKLNHPHIVTIHEFGERDGLYYFLMEYVDGVSLRGLLDSGHVTAKEALAIVPQICEALQYAHEQGIVHRDIKPENILLSKSGQVKIADFGLAKLMNRGIGVPPMDGTGGEEITGEIPVSEGQTIGGTPIPLQGATVRDKVMGTPQYMAPEQVERPGEVDHRADIYSLGVVFYQMLTGELPKGKFEAPSKRTKLIIDVRLDEVVLRALEREPGRRYQQVREIKTEVETIASSPAEMEQPIAASRIADKNVDQITQVAGKPTVISASGYERGITVITWVIYIFGLLYAALPFFVLGIDPGDPVSKHLFRFSFMPLVGLGVAILGFILHLVLRYLLVRIGYTNIPKRHGVSAKKLTVIVLSVFLGAYFIGLGCDQWFSANHGESPTVGLSLPPAEIMIPNTNNVPLDPTPIEQTINDLDDGKGNEGLSFGAEKPITLPPKFRTWSETQRQQWMTDQKVDLFVEFAGNRWTIMGTTLQIAKLKATSFDQISQMTMLKVDEALLAPDSAIETVTRNDYRFHIMPANVSPPIFMAFKTGGGLYGVMEIVAFTEKPHAAKIRYKLLRKSETSKSVKGTGQVIPEGLVVQALGKDDNFEPVIERVVNHTGKDCLIDLDTGKFVTLPPEIAGKGATEAMQWMKEHGIDAGGFVAEDSRGFIGFDLVAVPVPEKSWEGVAPYSLREMAATIKPGNQTIYAVGTALPATFIFATREGGMGLLQVRGFNENPKAVRIRYKLLKGATTQTTIIPADKPLGKGEQGEFYVMGKVLRPGVYSMRAPGITIKQALSAAGLTETNNLQNWRVVLIRRVAPNSELITNLSFAELFSGKTADRYLQNNDILNVVKALEIVPADKPVLPGQAAVYHVKGKVKASGTFDLTNRNLTVKQALAAQIDLGQDLKGWTFTLVRRDEKGEDKRIDINPKNILLGDEPDRFLQAEDVLEVRGPEVATQPVRNPTTNPTSSPAR